MGIVVSEMRSSLTGLMLATLLCWSPSGMAADEPPCPRETSSTPSAAVTSSFDELRRIFSRRLPGPRGRQLVEKRLHKLIERSIDLEFFMQGMLRVAWEKADDVQRVEWQAAIDSMLRKRYLRLLRAPSTQRVEISNVDVGCQKAALHVQVRDIRGGKSSTFDMNLRWGGQGWRVYDVHLDGVSLLQLWRSRFRRIYRDGGMRAIDRQMKVLAARYGDEQAAQR